MAKKSSTIKVEFKPSVILMLLSALTLFVLNILQFSVGIVYDKQLYNFFGQVWMLTWIMSFILLLTISSLFFKARLLKIIFGLIITLAAITSAVGLVFVAKGSHLQFFWDNNLLPALIAYIVGFIGSILWISNL